MPPKIPKLVICLLLFVFVFQVLLIFNYKLKIVEISKGFTLHIIIFNLSLFLITLLGLALFWAIKIKKIKSKESLTHRDTK